MSNYEQNSGKKKTQAFGNLFIRLGNFDTTCESDMNTT
jgi:hypothetical protein